MTKPPRLSPAAPSKHKRQIAAFGGVGLFCTLIDLVAFSGLIALGAAPVIANVMGFLIANIIGYFLNGWLTFRRDGERAAYSARGYGKYLSAYLVGLTLSTLFIAVFAPQIGAIVAKLCTIAFTAVLNYCASAFFVFTDRKPRASEPPTESS